MENMDFIVNL